MGLVAQEAEKVLPGLVYEDNGFKYLRYDRLGPLLIEGVKDQQKEINGLKEEMAGLKEENAELRKRLSALESRLPD